MHTFTVIIGLGLALLGVSALLAILGTLVRIATALETRGEPDPSRAGDEYRIRVQTRAADARRAGACRPAPITRSPVPEAP